jgi:hypothetical protein
MRRIDLLGDQKALVVAAAVLEIKMVSNFANVHTVR